jgi:hypothetical protein
MTAVDLAKILLNQYSLSDLEFGMGSTIEDLQFGLEDFVDNYYGEIVDMLKEDDLWEGPEEE